MARYHHESMPVQCDVLGSIHICDEAGEIKGFNANARTKYSVHMLGIGSFKTLVESYYGKTISRGVPWRTGSTMFGWDGGNRAMESCSTECMWTIVASRMRGTFISSPPCVSSSSIITTSIRA